MRRKRVVLELKVPSGEQNTWLIAALEEALARRGCELLSPVSILPVFDPSVRVEAGER